MAMEAYYYPNTYYYLPPPTVEEEEEQLHLHLQSFLSDFDPPTVLPHSYLSPDPANYDSFFADPPPKRQQLCSCTAWHKEAELGKGRATVQSTAARDRRKKISDKTVELGKLIPGGKMNTAEMLQHGFKYVKFMQSQLSLLQLIQFQFQEEERGRIDGPNLEIVGSRAVQEKLCIKDMCLVPIDFLRVLAENGDLRRQGSVLMDLNELIQSVSVKDC